MEYYIIKLEITMYDRASVSSWEIRPNVIHDLVKPLMGTANRLYGLVVFDDCLLCFYSRKCAGLTAVEVFLLAIPLQPKRIRIQRVQPGLCFD